MKFNLSKIKWPFVSRKKFEQVEAQSRNYKNSLIESQREAIELRDELTPKILRIAENIFKTNWKNSDRGQRLARFLSESLADAVFDRSGNHGGRRSSN